MMQDLWDKIKRNRYLILLFLAVAAAIGWGIWNYIRMYTIPSDLNLTGWETLDKVLHNNK